VKTKHLTSALTWSWWWWWSKCTSALD